jgi:hypothetical protein
LDDGFNLRLIDIPKKFESEVNLFGTHPANICAGRFQVFFDLFDLFQDCPRNFNCQKRSDQLKNLFIIPPYPPLIKGGKGGLLIFDVNTITKKVNEKKPLEFLSSWDFP